MSDRTFAALSAQGQRIVTTAAFDRALEVARSRELEVHGPVGGFCRRPRVHTPPANVVATYVAHTVLGCSLRQLADLTSRNPGNLHRAVRRIEGWRDDPRLDRALDELTLEVLP